MSFAATSSSFDGPRAYHGAHRWSVRGIVAIVAAHVGVLAGLAAFDALPSLPPPLTLMVEVIAPTPPKPLPMPVERQPAKPVAKPRVPSSPQKLTAPAETASAVAEAPPVARETPAPSAPAAAAAPAPAPVQSPRFDAAYLNNPAPTYPALARRLGEEGKVVLRVFVEPDGRPGQIEVKAGSGSPRLDQAAQDAVWRWKFVAARRGEETLGAWVLVPIVFNLRG